MKLRATLQICLTLVLLAGCGSKDEFPPPDLTETELSETEWGSERTGEQEGVPREGEEEPKAPEYVFDNVHFEFDKHRLTQGARQLLTRHGKALLENKGWVVLIEGHCDERGTVEYNLGLGEKRAESTRQFLIEQGVAAGRLTTISYGKERPIASGHNEEAWAKNRRAEFRVTR